MQLFIQFSVSLSCHEIANIWVIHTYFNLLCGNSLVFFFFLINNYLLKMIACSSALRAFPLLLIFMFRKSIVKIKQWVFFIETTCGRKPNYGTRQSSMNEVINKYERVLYTWLRGWFRKEIKALNVGKKIVTKNISIDDYQIITITVLGKVQLRSLALLVKSINFCLQNYPLIFQKLVHRWFFKFFDG